jgi:HrpA-like RNA helicase
MILEARQSWRLDEVLVIASALSVQDVRDRPMEAQQQPTRRMPSLTMRRANSVGYLKLWKWIDDEAPKALWRRPTRVHKLSNRQYEQLLRQNFISMRRVREWRDIYSQLVTVVAEHKWRINTNLPATSSCTCPCWPGCWATSAAKWLDVTGKRDQVGASTWVHAASSFTRIPVRIWSRNPAAGSWHPSWWKPRACLAAALLILSRSGWSR